MEEPRKLGSYGVYTREIGTLVKITSSASETKVENVISAPMLPSYDVFKLKELREETLWDVAILATLDF